MSEIKLKSIIKNFGGNSIAVDNLSEIFPDGEFVCLLGPSGCGKTTTLRMIAGLETPDSGEIFYGNKTFFSSKTGELTKTENRNLGLMFQSYALWPHMTVYKNIVFGLEMQKKTLEEKNKRYLELEKLFHLENFRDRYPSELSGGQQQRVALARMLAIKPSLLLLDEPLSNLDSNLRLEMRSELKRLHQSIGCTIIFVTHDQMEAMTLATSIAVMNKGKIEQIDKPMEIYNNPKSLFVAKFVGSPQMNIIN
jgi:iron(III) transport system ATP-binding protein